MKKRSGAATGSSIRLAVGVTYSQTQAVKKKLDKLGLLQGRKVYGYGKPSSGATRAKAGIERPKSARGEKKALVRTQQDVEVKLSSAPVHHAKAT
jgi:hypothetical protein